MQWGPPLPLDQYHELCEKAKRVEWMERFIKKLTPKSVDDFTDVYIVISGRELKRVWKMIEDVEAPGMRPGAKWALGLLNLTPETVYTMED